MRIGITDTFKPNLKMYTEWLRRVDDGTEFIVLSHRNNNLEALDSVDGLMLTGGGDVDPRCYGLDDPHSQAREVDRARDEFEFRIIERALDREIPILGVCRGMQAMNVYLGGSLVLDLPSAGFEDHAGRKHEIDHRVDVEPQSLLHEIVGTEVLDVNSSHHQAVGQLGNGLMASAVSMDGVVEAAEWILKDRMPFLLLVQWHPERMEKEFENPASKKVAEKFLEQMNQTRTNQPSTTTSHPSKG